MRRTLAGFVGLSVIAHLLILAGIRIDLPDFERAPPPLEARLEPALGAGHFGGRGVEGAGPLLRRQRHRGLAEHRRHHRRLGHHGQRIAAGEAHADRADTFAAAFGVRLAREGAQPIHDGAGAVGPPQVELAPQGKCRWMVRLASIMFLVRINPARKIRNSYPDIISKITDTL